MIVRVCVSRSAALRIAVAVATIALGVACSSTPPDPIVIEANRITVFNRTSTPWLGVEIWVNQQYRMTQPAIWPGERFQSPLDAFVEGFGHRFDYRRQQIKDVRLKAKLPNNKPIEIVKDFDEGGLAGLARSLKGKK